MTSTSSSCPSDSAPPRATPQRAARATSKAAGASAPRRAGCRARGHARSQVDRTRGRDREEKEEDAHAIIVAQLVEFPNECHGVEPCTILKEVVNAFAMEAVLAAMEEELGSETRPSQSHPSHAEDDTHHGADWRSGVMALGALGSQQAASSSYKQQQQSQDGEGDRVSHGWFHGAPASHAHARRAEHGRRPEHGRRRKRTARAAA